MQDGVLPTGNSAAGGIVDLNQRNISKFSCYRDSLFDEAEALLLLHFNRSNDLFLPSRRIQ